MPPKQKVMFADVVVIGARPAGTTTARMIAKHGFNVILVEKDKYPGETNVCASVCPKRHLRKQG